MNSLRKIIKEIFTEILDKSNLKIDLSSQIILVNNQQIGELSVMTNNAGYLLLDKIFINPEFRGNGYANEAMKQLIDYANKENKIIALTPDNVWKSGKGRLTKWYKSLGFIMNKGRNRDFKTLQLMYKLPESLKEIDSLETSSLKSVGGLPGKFPDVKDYDEFGNKLDDISR